MRLLQFIMQSPDLQIQKKNLKTIKTISFLLLLKMLIQILNKKNQSRLINNQHKRTMERRKSEIRRRILMSTWIIKTKFMNLCKTYSDLTVIRQPQGKPNENKTDLIKNFQNTTIRNNSNSKRGSRHRLTDKTIHP